MTKPSDALASVRVALRRIADWNGDPGSWPSDSIHDAYLAVNELAKTEAAIGSADQRPSIEETGAFSIIATTKLHLLGSGAITDPDKRVQLVALLGILATELTQSAADIGTRASRQQQERSESPRYWRETSAQIREAGRVYRESHHDDSSPYYGQFESVESIAREVGRRLYDANKKPWPCKESTIARRLRKYRSSWENRGD